MRILYGMSSPNVLKVLILLEELALSFERRHVSVFTGENLTEEYRTLNPFAKVPILLDAEGEPPIFESGAILIHLAETYGPEFLPRSGPSRAATLQWLIAQTANIGPIFGQHSHFRHDPDRSPHAAERFRRTAAELYRILDRRLGQTPYFAGEGYSIADIAIYPWARYLGRHGMRREDLPHLTAWLEVVGGRPAVQRAMAQLQTWGELDRRDRRQASDEDRRRFAWMHFDAPSAEEAASRRLEPSLQADGLLSSAPSPRPQPPAAWADGR